jgi:predicted nuclease with TOPRIM domain
MRALRKTNPIDTKIHELNDLILLLRELKKLRQENANLREFLTYWDSKYGNVDEMEDIITKLSARNGRLEEELKRLKNATS